MKEVVLHGCEIWAMVGEKDSEDVYKPLTVERGEGSRIRK
jgi:hypothetical protein